MNSNTVRRPDEDATDRLHKLLLALRDKTRFDHPTSRFELLQTHISYVLLTGPYAYKFKKPVDLGFLDFTTLEKRKFFLDEELRLNRRLAAELYIDVVPITGSDNKPRIGRDGRVIEYALKMVQFPQQAQLDRVLDRGLLTPAHIDELAGQVAAFHQEVPEVDASNSFGAPQLIRKSVLENFEQLAGNLDEQDLRNVLDYLRNWTLTKSEALEEVFMNRRREGRIRECHGDMHLRNMTLFDGRIVIFDCIEFSDALRWIDVMSEVAFLLMDLDFRNRRDLAHRFLNKYLEYSGDYSGLMVLEFYRVYRALVRAKVASIQLRQTVGDAVERDVARRRLEQHVALAKSYTGSRTKIPLIITYGLSGSGKTRFTEQLIEHLGAIRSRSDVERKRLQGLPPLARSDSGMGKDLYSAEMTKLTYQRLREIAGQVLNCGYPVIVDATFLRKIDRDMFRGLAGEKQVPFRILNFQAPYPVLRSRIERRQTELKDASEAGLEVLEHQFENHEPITDAEHDYTMRLSTEEEFNVESIAAQINRL